MSRENAHFGRLPINRNTFPHSLQLNHTNLMFKLTFEHSKKTPKYSFIIQ